MVARIHSRWAGNIVSEWSARIDEGALSGTGRGTMITDPLQSSLLSLGREEGLPDLYPRHQTGALCIDTDYLLKGNK